MSFRGRNAAFIGFFTLTYWYKYLKNDIDSKKHDDGISLDDNKKNVDDLFPLVVAFVASINQYDDFKAYKAAKKKAADALTAKNGNPRNVTITSSQDGLILDEVNINAKKAAINASRGDVPLIM